MIRKCCVVERPSRARPFSRCVSWCGLGKLEASHSNLAAWLMCRTRAWVRLRAGTLNPPESPEGPKCSKVVPIVVACVDYGY